MMISVLRVGYLRGIRVKCKHKNHTEAGYFQDIGRLETKTKSLMGKLFVVASVYNIFCLDCNKYINLWDKTEIYDSELRHIEDFVIVK